MLYASHDVNQFAGSFPCFFEKMNCGDGGLAGAESALMDAGGPAW
jgi:hypothetical protein